MEQYLENTKENVFYNFTIMIKNSWTYARMTENEQKRIIDLLNDERTKRETKGTYTQRWNVLNLIYSSFLDGLGYKPIGWRETEEEKQGNFID